MSFQIKMCGKINTQFRKTIKTKVTRHFTGINTMLIFKTKEEILTLHLRQNVVIRSYTLHNEFNWRNKATFHLNEDIFSIIHYLWSFCYYYKFFPVSGVQSKMMFSMPSHVSCYTYISLEMNAVVDEQALNLASGLFSL